MPYFGEIFLLLMFGNVIHPAHWIIFLLVLFLVDNYFWYQKRTFTLPMFTFTFLFLLLNLSHAIHASWFWLIWFVGTDVSGLVRRAAGVSGPLSGEGALCKNQPTK